MKVRAVILAGGEGSRLGVLTAKRTKPAVAFAGKYRIIDFTLSNCVNSGIYDVMLSRTIPAAFIDRTHRRRWTVGPKPRFFRWCPNIHSI